MPKYRVQLRGEDFPMVIDGESRMVGFFTTRTVRAKDESEAELAAVAVVKSDTSLLESIDKNVESNPTIYLEEMAQVRWWSRLGGAGYTFFAME